MAKFSHYAMAAAQEALEDAEWHPQEPKDLEATVGRHADRHYTDHI